MTVPYNRAEIQQAIAQLLGIKGQFDSSADGILIPTIQVAQLWDTPYLRYGIPVADHGTINAVAAEFGYVVIQPGPGVALQIKQIYFSVTVAAAQRAGVRILTAANIATAGLATSTVQVTDLSANPAGTKKSSKLIFGTHTAEVGDKILDIRGAANTVAVIDLPDPGIILYGNDSGGVPGLGVTGEVVNENITAGFIGREWPLPG